LRPARRGITIETMRMRARSLLLVGLGCFACGPSLNTVHEGSVRFEHCYGVDLNPKAEPTQRKACWQLWVTSYTVGQPRDRIEYAQRRLHALDGNDDKCPQLALGRDQPPEARQFYLVVPTPTSVHTTPPPVATVVQASDAGVPPEVPSAEHAKSDGGGAKTSDATKEPPAESCANRCRSAWQSCDNACATPSGKSVCADCKTAYTRCMRGCFQ
jgi:hypothetical protein